LPACAPCFTGWSAKARRASRPQFAVGKLAQRLDDLDHAVLELRERGHRLQEEVSSLMTEETNRHLHILSILTTLLLPPTLVTGFFGMNVKGLPFTENENGFLWSVLILVVSSVGAYLLMRQIGVIQRPPRKSDSSLPKT
jgi:zinc transporter